MHSEQRREAFEREELKEAGRSIHVSLYYHSCWFCFVGSFLSLFLHVFRCFPFLDCFVAWDFHFGSGAAALFPFRSLLFCGVLFFLCASLSLSLSLLLAKERKTKREGGQYHTGPDSPYSSSDRDTSGQRHGSVFSLSLLGLKRRRIRLHGVTSLPAPSWSLPVAPVYSGRSFPACPPFVCPSCFLCVPPFLSSPPLFSVAIQPLPLFGFLGPQQGQGHLLLHAYHLLLTKQQRQQQVKQKYIEQDERIQTLRF
jgi:hypothetical protein